MLWDQNRIITVIIMGVLFLILGILHAIGLIQDYKTSVIVGLLVFIALQVVDKEK